MLSDLYKLQQHLKFLKDIQIDYSTRVLPFITSIAYINNINEDERKIKVNPLLISTIGITLTYLVIACIRMGMYTNVIMINLVFLFLALGLVSLPIYRKNWISLLVSSACLVFSVFTMVM